jgi:hypothetical protein
MANAGDSPFLFPSDLNRSGTRPLSRRSGTRLFGGPRFPTSESTTFDPRMPATECRRRSRRVVHTKASPGRRASLRKVFADEIADEARGSGNGKRSANEKKKNGALQRSANGTRTTSVPGTTMRSPISRGKKQRLRRCPQITSNPGTRVQSQARISDRGATASENWEFPTPLRGEVVP